MRTTQFSFRTLASIGFSALLFASACDLDITEPSDGSAPSQYELAPETQLFLYQDARVSPAQSRRLLSNLEVPSRMAASALGDPLYSQTPSGILRISCASVVGCRLADDFVVPLDETWTFTHVQLTGHTPLPSGFTFYFYEDGGGIPGTLLATEANLTDYTATPNGSVAEDFLVPLDEAVILSEGTYWLGVQIDEGNPDVSPFSWAVNEEVINGTQVHVFGSGDNWRPFSLGAYDAAFALFGTTEELSPSVLIEALLAQLDELDLDPGITNSLRAKLQAAYFATSSDRTEAACGVLNALIGALQALSGKRIPTSEADGLIADAMATREAIGC